METPSVGGEPLKSFKRPFIVGGLPVVALFCALMTIPSGKQEGYGSGIGKDTPQLGIQDTANTDMTNLIDSTPID